MPADGAQTPETWMDALFACQKCGHCCHGYGGTVVSPADIERIAAFIGTSPALFTQNYCQRSGNKVVLAQGPNGYCVFWDKLCTIHPVKPRMCRHWPFIEALVIDPGNWRVMADTCPGMRADASAADVANCMAALLAKRRSAQTDQ